MANLTRRFVIAFSAAVLGLALVSPGSARAQQADATGLDSVQKQQEQAVRQGVESGAISRKEATQLAKGEKHIKIAEAQDKAKGPLTNAEAKQLKRANQRENAAINHATRNGRR